MSDASNDRGRAYEYAFVTALQDAISAHRDAYIVENKQYEAVKAAWGRVDLDMQEKLRYGSISAVQTLFDLEPLIIEDGSDILTLRIQEDATGQGGDVRDILIIRRALKWEIGLSMKHNHFAAKHPRLSGTIDFGEKWFGVPCSKTYWEEIKPLFEDLKTKKENGILWKELPNKDEDYYKPLLDAFMAEVMRSYETHKEIPQNLVAYFLGEYDFYKVIAIDSKRTTEIQTFNLHGTLNRKGKKPPITTIPKTNLPTRIIALDYKPGSSNTAEMFLDSGWTFSFRVHNAKSKVEPSLKFDIQIVGVPTTIVTFTCSWE